MKKIRELRTGQRRAYAEAQRAYDQRCREVWREDRQVRQHRDNATRMRRRELRLERMVASELESLIGPEPDC